MSVPIEVALARELWTKRRHPHRLATRLTPAEMRAFRGVRRFVRSYCGKVSDAEVLRFLVRNWEPRA